MTSQKRYDPLVLRLLPLGLVVASAVLFGLYVPRFLMRDNLLAILGQSSWLVIAALGVNFILMTAGVDLSVGAVMYLAAVTTGLVLANAPLWLWPIAALIVGGLVGMMNAWLIVHMRLPAFVATLAIAFVARGAGLWASGTQMVFADPAIAALGRARFAGIPIPFLVALSSLLVCWALVQRTSLGLYVRAIGSDAEGAGRAGIPVQRTLTVVYTLGGALAGFAGLVSFCQVSAATAAFGLNAEFLAIAAAVLGGTSLLGGRGYFAAPVVGALLITTVQNGLVLLDANPYAYPVVTGAVIFAAALLDTLRYRIAERQARRPILQLS